MDVTPYVTRLRTRAAADFAVISASADLDAAVNAPGAGNALYLIPLAESADEPTLVGIHTQRIEQLFGVVLCIGNVRDATGTAAAQDLAIKRALVRLALMGWVPAPTNGEPVEFVAGQILQFKEQRLWWQDVYRVVTYAVAAGSVNDVAASFAGAIAAHLMPYAALEIAGPDAWASADFPPYATGAVGFMVYGGQPPVNGGTRAELSIDKPHLEGDTLIYRWKAMIPAAGAADPANRWWVITQWHVQPPPGEAWTSYVGMSPPVSISFGEISGQSKLSINYGAPTPGYVSPLLDIARDTWYDMEMTIHWSQGPDGYAALRVNGIAAWNAAGANMQNGYRHYFKLGEYRHPEIGLNPPVAGGAPFWVWFDEIDVV